MHWLGRRYLDDYGAELGEFDKLDRGKWNWLKAALPPMTQSFHPAFPFTNEELGCNEEGDEATIRPPRGEHPPTSPDPPIQHDRHEHVHDHTTPRLNLDLPESREHTATNHNHNHTNPQTCIWEVGDEKKGNTGVGGFCGLWSNCDIYVTQAQTFVYFTVPPFITFLLLYRQQALRKRHWRPPAAHSKASKQASSCL